MENAIKILIVDDEPDIQHLIRMNFRREVRNKLYQFFFASNGLDAFTIIQANPDISVILSDINMPGMDGIEMLEKLQISNPIVKTIMVTAYGDMTNIRAAMNRGAFDFITKPVNFEDLKITLTRTIEYTQTLRKTIGAIKENNILKMYVDESVLRFMTSHEFEESIVKNQSVTGAVAFIDLCGFTAFSETRQPNLIINLLNTFFDTIVKEIISHSGYIDKFIGDAVMAVFLEGNFTENALNASLSIRKKISELNIEENFGITFKPDISIGINVGEMVSGNIGSKSLSRFDFTVIGDTVNTASRFQNAAKDGEIIVSSNIVTQFQNKFIFEFTDERKFKNKANPFLLYNLISKNNIDFEQN